jgi:FMN reductase
MGATDAPSATVEGLAVAERRVSRMSTNIVVLVGSATPPGRTQTMAGTLAEALRGHADVTADLIDLANVAFEAADGRPVEKHHPTIAGAVGKIASADGLVIASPVYRATYTGVLKNFLDIVPFEALRDKPVGLAVLAASQHHYLGVDTALRGIVAWYGAIAAPTSVYLTNSDFDEQKQLTPRARGELESLSATMVSLATILGGAKFGPTPIAAPRS